MKLSKIVFRGHVDGIFGESVSSLCSEPNPTIRQVEALEVTPLGLLVTKIGGDQKWVPTDVCMYGDLEKAPAEPEAPAPKQKAR